MIIGFTGKMQSGKSTACRMIIEELMLPEVSHINFKDGLVEEMKERLPDVLDNLLYIYQNDSWFPENSVNSIDDLFRVKPPAMRALMQNYGTEVRRKDDAQYWVKKWKCSVQEARALKNSIICDDVRFINEADAVKEVGGIIVRIVRPEVEVVETHQSETEMDQIVPDYTIEVETGNFDKLREELKKII